MSKFSIGDEIVVSSFDTRVNGKTGVIVGYEPDADCPYIVEFDGGLSKFPSLDYEWAFVEGELALVASQPSAAVENTVAPDADGYFIPCPHCGTRTTNLARHLELGCPNRPPVDADEAVISRSMIADYVAEGNIDRVWDVIGDLQRQLASQETELSNARVKLAAAEAALKSDHDHMKQALIHKMQERSELRDQLIEAALSLNALPEHADTHMECYLERDLIAAIVERAARSPTAGEAIVAELEKVGNEPIKAKWLTNSTSFEKAAALLDETIELFPDLKPYTKGMSGMTWRYTAMSVWELALRRAGMWPEKN